MENMGQIMSSLNLLVSMKMKLMSDQLNTLRTRKT